jgi:hypothetical protein
LRQRNSAAPLIFELSFLTIPVEAAAVEHAQPAEFVPRTIEIVTEGKFSFSPLPIDKFGIEGRAPLAVSGLVSPAV